MTTNRAALLLVGLVFLPATPLVALADGPDKAPKETSKPMTLGQVEIRFTNGSVVVMTLLQDKIEIQTDYGKLVVPPQEVRHISFGIHATDEERRKIDVAIGHLSSKSYKEREKAVVDLVTLGPQSYLRLLNVAPGADPETATRVEAALKKIREKVPARLLRLREEDVVRTSKFTIVGFITTPTLKVKAEDFGELELRPARLLAMHQIGTDDRKEVVIDAAVYGVQGGVKWLDTGVRVDPRQGLKISATGQVDLFPQQGGQFVTGPDGAAAAQGRFFRGPRARAGGELLGRIGDNGSPFLIGSRYTHTPTETGHLYLQIVPSPHGVPAAGEYRVTITSGLFGDDGDRGE